MRTEAWAAAAGRAILVESFSCLDSAHWPQLGAMSILSRLDAKFGRFAVPNLTVMLIIGQVFMFVAQQLDAGQQGFHVLERIRFYPDRVLAGEYWRVLTFVFDPPVSNLLFAVFFWYMFYLMGTTLEVTWGTFRYNVYLLIGYIASVVCTFAMYFAMGNVAGIHVSNGFLYGTVFLAFARFFPDFTLYIMFVIPIKIRWIAIFQWIGYVYGFLVGPWMIKAMIFASVVNYLLFFGGDIWRGLKQGHRRMRYQARALQAPPRIVHTCRTCGITSDDAPHMQFRYCSKCAGDACYCPAHLTAHEHVVAQATGAGEKTRD
jgi:hypothetical protein